MLTKREQQVALLIAQGLPSKIIARQCNITLRTVKAHLTNIYAKLGIVNRTQLAVHMANSAIIAATQE